MRADQFEALGLRALYVPMARIVRETVLPASAATEVPLSQKELAEVAEGSHYFAKANVARAACYLPHLIAFAWIRSLPGLCVAVGLIFFHALIVLIDLYKQALCRDLSPRARPAPLEEAVPKLRSPKGFFTVLPFETEAFYRWIGLEYFRRFVKWVMSTISYGFSGKQFEYIAKPNRTATIAFEQSTRVSEAVHWLSAVSVLPLVVLSWIHAPLGIALWSTFIIWGDLMLALLQRYHRTRAWPLLKRLLKRAE
ncbi:MAG: hypothetical protein JSS66_14270 [Armatimonadetes bacterium]|nr:hypothetical protein [Armatimonadota bacterium]